MTINPNLPNSRLLFSAVYAYLRELWPWQSTLMRPYIVELYEEVLLDFTSRWLAEGGDMGIGAVHCQWLTEYLLVAPDRAIAHKVLQSFFQWAVMQKLVQRNPLYTLQDNTVEYTLGYPVGYTMTKLLET